MAAYGLIERFNKSYKVSAIKRSFGQAFLAPLRRLTLPAKIRARTSLWIHFGCGDVADTRFINVDARLFPHVDYVTKSPTMPAMPRATADLIYACHVFEHVPYATQSVVLGRWRQILKPGGKLMLSVPDFDKLLSLYESGERDIAGIQPPLMGGQEYAGNFHFAIFTKRHLTNLLINAGFSDVQEWRADEQREWPKDWSWDESLSLNLLATNH